MVIGKNRHVLSETPKTHQACRVLGFISVSLHRAHAVPVLLFVLNGGSVASAGRCLCADLHFVICGEWFSPKSRKAVYSPELSVLRDAWLDDLACAVERRGRLFKGCFEKQTEARVVKVGRTWSRATRRRVH